MLFMIGLSVLEKGAIEMQKKTMLGVSFALAAALVVGGMALAAGSDDNKGNDLAAKMINAMNSPEGQEMVKSCGKFMESYDKNSDGAKIEKNSTASF
ncbi:hypothetical protein [Effusibacillus consociatus]|uniref:Uncharacterized protein n=1 Tax=Effusibacillus consociatus TaxID=1117041 RepID=A0ABV9PYX3_9BACL